jgi:hypothetical protein
MRRLRVITLLTIAMNFYGCGSGGDSHRLTAFNDNPPVDTAISNISVASWSILEKPMPDEAIHGIAVALLSTGEVLLTGGSSYAKGFYASTYVYNPSSGLYSSLPQLPVALYNAQAERLLSGNILVFGGYGEEGYSDDCYIFNSSEKTWILSDKIPLKIQAHASTTTHDGNPIFFGGDNAETGGDGEFSDQVWLYSEPESKWIRKQDLPEGIMYAAATLLLDGTILIVGGHTNVDYASSAYIYNSDLDYYIAVEPAPVAMRGGFLETLNSGEAIYGGGESAGGLYESKSHYFDPESLRWIIGVDDYFPKPRAFGDSVKLIDGTILVFGGNESANRQTKTVMRYGS